MVKKIVLASIVGIGFVGCNSAQLQQLTSQTNHLTNAFQKKETVVNTNTTPNNLPSNCVPRNSSESLSFTQRITEKIVTHIIDSALKDVSTNKHVKIPKKITNTCEADQRLAYVRTLTKSFAADINNANADILSSVEQTKEIQKLQEEINHKKKTLDEAEFNEGVSEDNSKTFELIKNAKVVDKKKYSSAMGKLALATPINGYIIVGWDKEILEFAKDNIVWGIKNLSALKDVASQLTTTIKVLPTLTSLTTSPFYDGRVDEDIAKKAAQEAIKKEEEIAKAAAEENGFDD